MILLTMLIFTVGNLEAANYYFSTSTGDDSRTNGVAQHSSTPWKTIEKLNSISTLLKPGDSIFFKRGDVFHGTITLKSSGTGTAPIVITAYGNGINPVISGVTTLNAWKLYSKGIYTSNCSACKSVSVNMVLINGVQQAMGRYPNSGYLTYTTHRHNKSIGGILNGNPTDWRGAELVIRKNHWLIDRCLIGECSGGKISYSEGSATEPTDGFGFFFQNDPRAIDKFGEWFYDRVTENIMLYFGNYPPSSYSIEVSVINNLLVMDGCHSIRIQNLSLTGAASRAFYIKNSKDIQIRNCAVDLSATDGIVGSGSVNLLVQSTIINHALNDAINLDSSCRMAIVRDNRIKNTGMIPGMGKSGSGTYQALSIFGANSLVIGNEIDSTGYNAIYFGGDGTTIENNLITNFCTTKDDGAGIYIGDWFPSAGKRILGNIILMGQGVKEGTNEKNLLPVEGIYIDDNSANVEISSNAVADCSDAGIKIHNARNIRLDGNILFNNGNQLLVAHDNLQPNSPVRDLQARKNIFFSLKPEQPCLYIYSVNDDLGSMALMDSNFYYRPATDRSYIKAVANIWSAKTVANDFSLSRWQEDYRQDQHSKTIASTTDLKKIVFEYNFSPKMKQISQQATYLMPGHVGVASTMQLQPYQATIYFKSTGNKY